MNKLRKTLSFRVNIHEEQLFKESAIKAGESLSDFAKNSMKKRILELHPLKKDDLDDLVYFLTGKNKKVYQ